MFVNTFNLQDKPNGNSIIEPSRWIVHSIRTSPVKKKKMMMKTTTTTAIAATLTPADMLTISRSSDPPRSRTEFIASILAFANDPQTTCPKCEKTYYPQVLGLLASLGLRTKATCSIIFIVSIMSSSMGLNSSPVKGVRKEELKSSILYSSSSELMFRAFLYKSALETHIKTAHSAKAEERAEKKSHYRHECSVCHKKYLRPATSSHAKIL